MVQEVVRVGIKMECGMGVESGTGSGASGDKDAVRNECRKWYGKWCEWE